jgi:prepilin signal peptidase PulO-like enzyme (type II secretory pathway)
MSCIRFAELTVFVGLGIAISISDIRAYRIPNSLSYPYFAAITALAIAAGPGGPRGRIEGILFNVAFYSLCRFCSRGGLGIGDIKLSAITGFFVGFPGVMAAGLAASVAALPFAIAKAARKPPRAAGSESERARARVAFAPFLLIASLMARVAAEADSMGLIA